MYHALYYSIFLVRIADRKLQKSKWKYQEAELIQKSIITINFDAFLNHKLTWVDISILFKRLYIQNKFLNNWNLKIF